MSDIAAIAGVESRIAAIRSRIGVATGTMSANALADVATDIGSPTDPTVGFDPFGAIYQHALVSAGISGTSTGDDVDATTGLVGDVAGSGVEATGASTGAFTSAGSLAVESLGASARSTSSPYSSSSPSSPYSSYSSYASSSVGVLDHAVRVGYSGTSMVQSANGWTSVGGEAGQSVGQIGGYGEMPVPAELAPYGNGRIPSAALQSIGQGGHRLYAPAAQQWLRMVDAAAAQGVTMRVTDSYRSYDQQVDLASRKGLYKDGGYAATPGTSNHGWGLAIDLDTDQPAALAWMKANGHDYGFVEAVPREPWHWEYRPNQA